MRPVSPQPNLALAASDIALTRRFWLMVVLAGISAGLAGGALMLVLNFMQHLAWPFQAGDNLLQAIERASAERRVLCLTTAGATLTAGSLDGRSIYSARAVGVDGESARPPPTPETPAAQSPGLAESNVLRTGTHL
jgi:hypothetical protein